MRDAGRVSRDGWTVKGIMFQCLSFSEDSELLTPGT
jgi:hypothetical protein